MIIFVKYKYKIMQYVMFPAETLIFYTVMHRVSIAVAIHYEKTMASLLCRFNFHTECIDCKCVIKASRPAISVIMFTIMDRKFFIFSTYW